jgi:DNA polymerase-3 subunit alpha
MSANFVSLHNHTEYSFLDGAIKIKNLVEKAKAFGMPAVAITDHGGLFGAVEFYEVCVEQGIKPVIGFEAYVAPGSRFEKSQVKEKDERYYSHLILLAKDNTGWKNLMQLSTIGYLEGFYYKPRIDMEVLRRYSEGIIATSACAAGAIPQAILRGDIDGARKLTEEYISIFGRENFYFELQDHGIEEEKAAMRGLIALGREMGVPFIVANDAHYLRHEDAPSHEILLCIGTKDKMDNPKRFRFTSDQVYFKSPEEMAKLFPDIPEAMTNTVEIAERCNVDIKVKPQLPSVDVPAEYEGPGEYLSHLARNGLRERYADVTPELEEKLEYELKVINEMDFAGYFLIVRDFVMTARGMDIPVGCRGSAAGSLVVYAIGITDVDPIKFDLIFERFLNPERITMPDADIDFADRDRYKIIDYVVNKYGRESVCQIINFGTMGAKNVVRDVARVMDVPVGDATRLSSMITEKTLKESIEANKELAGTINGSSQYRELFRHAGILEGLTRQPGMHAAGVIIAPGKVSDWAPLFKQTNKQTDTDVIMTQFDMNYVEKVGLVKMDFLGLITLTVLQEALRLIKKYHNIVIDPCKLPEDDQKTFELFGNGETTGIFQFESGGMKENLRKLKPTCVEDLIAMAALYRPGPMDNIGMFIDRKHGREKSEYAHPLLEEILSVTYGVIVYQEQVMRIAQVMAGFSLGQADILRKAMGKKNIEGMDKMRDTFVKGAASKNIGKKTAEDVFGLIAKFAKYGFNKAHATVYAHLSYQTAYLKAHYPLEYMTAFLTAYLGKPDDFLVMRNEAERLGIRVLPPDVNTSDNAFGIDAGAIRIGLEAVKNVGKAAELILKAREERGRFSSIFDICASTDNRIVNKKALESLICAGAFDGFEGTRAQHMAAVDSALEYGKSVQAERESGQFNLFGGPDAAAVAAPEPSLPDAVPWTMNEKLQKEKDILGFYASGRPLDQFRDEIEAFTDSDITPETLRRMKNNSPVTVGGFITAFRGLTQKKDNRAMAVMTLELLDSSIEIIAFADAYAKYRETLAQDAMVFVHGRVLNRDEVKVSVEGCMHLFQVREALAKGVHVRLSSDGFDAQRAQEIYDCCIGYPGDCCLVIHVTTADGNKHRIRSKSITVSPRHEVIKKLRDMAGKDNVWISKAID